ncbi:hypothetical protein KR215_007974 [Drosophila sulfurigaster]|uniref:protein Diedel-like n=1 Tax=Drosophila sulfurigaster albostrigata TaxID=89887 RepID=UPI002D21A668|nr:protein Diedel-like [Drosophila sulfurigaster albostrigata]KAH8398503.1 hypothetical protein KR215_007974 [Drosophila sulfurigaster]
MHFIGLSLFVILAMESWQLGNGDCCTKTRVKFEINEKNGDCHDYHKSSKIIFSDQCTNRLCGDLSSNSLCCGVGSCDVFCCGCDRGCIKGDVGKEFKKVYGKKITLISPKLEKEPIKVVVHAYNITVEKPDD